MSSTLSEDWRRDHDYYKVHDYLQDFVGCSKKQKLMDDLCDALYFAKLDWAHARRVKFSPEVCLVLVTEPSTGEILSVGGTLPGDLFTDNYGLGILQNPLRAPIINNTAPSVSLKDTGGAARTFTICGNTATNGTFSCSGVSVGSQMQVGSSTTAPARADVTVGTAFGTAPESTFFSTGTGSYTAGSGTTTVSGSITAGNESATINEAILLFEACDNGGTAREICICHDATTATPFSNAKSITVQYSITD